MIHNKLTDLSNISFLNSSFFVELFFKKRPRFGNKKIKIYIEAMIALFYLFITCLYTQYKNITKFLKEFKLVLMISIKFTSPYFKKNPNFMTKYFICENTNVDILDSQPFL